MGAQGTTTIDFGAFPGASDASVAVTGQGGIVSGSLVEAWIRPVATADHTEGEHMVETIKVFASTIVAATGFTIYGFNSNLINEPLEIQHPSQQNVSTPRGSGGAPSVGGKGTRLYGVWTVSWVWN